MNRVLFSAAFIVGAASVIAMSSVFLGVDVLALGITLLIGLVFAIGTIELVRFHNATQSLDSAISRASQVEAGDRLGFERWLDQLHASLRNATQLRIEGERVGLPAPVVTPYLVGLLVMLGLLGTFVGMVDTLKGAVVALEGSTELAAIREGLAAPIKGLGLAFGTSVAGVATSAMLGLMSTLCRRERVASTRDLDAVIHAEFRSFSLNYNRQETYKALQAQAQALPDLVQTLQNMADGLNKMGLDLGTQIHQQQDKFHESTGEAYQALAEKVTTSIEQTVGSLQHTLVDSGRLAGEGLQPVMKKGIAEITESVVKQVEASQANLQDLARQQIDSMQSQFTGSAESVEQSWRQAVENQRQVQESTLEKMQHTLAHLQSSYEEKALALLKQMEEGLEARLIKEQEREQSRLQQWCDRLEQLSSEVSSTWTAEANKIMTGQEVIVSNLSSEREAMHKQNQSYSVKMNEGVERVMSVTENLLNARTEAESEWLKEFKERTVSLSEQLTKDLSALHEQERQRGEAASQGMEQLEARFSEQLVHLANNLEEPMTRLIDTSSEVPKAAAEVISQLREEISNNIERDNKLLEERQKIMLELDSLAGSLTQSSESQREAISSLVGTSTEMLDNISQRFDQHVESEINKLSGAAEQIAGNAQDMSTMGDAFAQAMMSFTESNAALAESMDKIEMALNESSSRNNEQLAYYVSQARELIDHSVMSQKAMFDELRQVRELSHA